MVRLALGFVASNLVWPLPRWESRGLVLRNDTAQVTKRASECWEQEVSPGVPGSWLSLRKHSRGRRWSSSPSVRRAPWRGGCLHGPRGDRSPFFGLHPQELWVQVRVAAGHGGLLNFTQASLQMARTAATSPVATLAFCCRGRSPHWGISLSSFSIIPAWEARSTVLRVPRKPGSGELRGCGVG